MDDEYAGGEPKNIGFGYDIMNGTALCYENICSDPGYRNPIFVSIYVGVPQSNFHHKRCPFGATTVCINSPV